MREVHYCFIFIWNDETNNTPSISRFLYRLNVTTCRCRAFEFETLTPAKSKTPMTAINDRNDGHFPGTRNRDRKREKGTLSMQSCRHNNL